jgi:NAD(P)-dependent dehydrogenase (short-subunit alcohol dehydrogenase family)
VIVACRDVAKGTAAAEEINRKTQGSGKSGSAVCMCIDLNDLKTVVAFASDFKEKYGGVDLLILNAGVGTTGFAANNLSLCFQVNYLGHFLLVQLLLPPKKINRSAVPTRPRPMRVVNLSSVMANKAYSKYEELSMVSEGYSSSKLYCALLTYELNKRMSKSLRRVVGYDKGESSKDAVDRDVICVSTNPGAVMSDIWRYLQGFQKVAYDLFMLTYYLTPHQGASAVVYAATVKESVVEAYAMKTQEAHGLGSEKVGGRFMYNPLLPSSAPYWSPTRACYWAFVGAYMGPRFSPTTLPANVDEVSAGLWKFSVELCRNKLSEVGVKVDLED